LKDLRYHRMVMVLRRGWRLRRLALLGVVLHTLCLAIVDFEHHDLLCHFKTPQHCTSCALSPLGSEPRSTARPGTCCLTDTGLVVALDISTESALLPVRTRDRSPPPSA
jgi:hypothetical protein